VPYIDYGTVNSTGYASYKPFTVTVNDLPVYDETDYRTGSNKLLLTYGESNNRKEFVFLGDKIYLNQIITAEDQRTISVKYNYLTEFVKLRVTLYKTDPLNLHITPRLFKYILKVKTSW